MSLNEEIVTGLIFSIDGTGKNENSKKMIDDQKRDDIDREPNSFSKNVEQPRTTMRFHDRAGLPTDASLYATIDVKTCNQQSFLFLFAVLITL